MKNRTEVLADMCNNEDFVITKRLWMYEANELCSKMKGHMHVISSKRSNDYVSSTLKKYPNECKWGMFCKIFVFFFAYFLSFLYSRMDWLVR